MKYVWDNDATFTMVANKTEWAIEDLYTVRDIKGKVVCYLTYGGYCPDWVKKVKG